MDREIQQRLQWVRLYEETGNAGLVFRGCGISKPTLRKWWKRYQQDGKEGLVNQSRRPHHSPKTKVGRQEEQFILTLRIVLHNELLCRANWMNRPGFAGDSIS